MKRIFLTLLFLAGFCYIPPAAAQTSVTGRIVVGLAATKPATCVAGDTFIASDTPYMYVCGPANTWTPLLFGGLATTQVAFGSATNTIAGSANFTWDNTNKSLTVTNAGTNGVSLIGSTQGATASTEGILGQCQQLGNFTCQGGQFLASDSGAGPIGTLVGVYSVVSHIASGTLATMTGLEVGAIVGGGAGAITTSRGIHVGGVSFPTGTTPVTQNGIIIDDQCAGSFSAPTCIGLNIAAQSNSGIAASFGSAMNANAGGALNGSFSGPTTLTGTLTATGNVTATAGQNILKAYNFNNILYVDGIKYTTLAAALAVCPATGCMILDTFIETFAADPFASITAPFEVHLIGGTSTAIWTTNVGLRIGHNGQTLYGAGPNLTEIKASGTFPGATAVVSVGAPGPSGVNGSGVFNLAIDCNSTAGCIGIHLDGAQELSGTQNTQVVNAMAAGFQVSSAQGAGADQNRMPLDHIRSACSVSAAATCVPVLIASTAGARVVIRDVTAVTTTPTVTTDCIRSDSSNATVILEDAHVEECTNGFHHTAAGGLFEVDGITGSTTTTTLVKNDNSAAGYQLRQLILNSSTNTLIDTGRSITTTSPYCSALGVSTSFVSCVDRAVPFQFPSSLRITPPLGAGPAIQVQLLNTFTGATPAFYVLDDSGNTQADITNDGRFGFRGGQTGAFVQTLQSDTLTAGRAIQTPNGASNTVMTAALVTTAAATDNVTVQGMASGGRCSLTPTNAAASGAASVPYISAKAANQITVTHAVTANMNYDVMCTSN